MQPDIKKRKLMLRHKMLEGLVGLMLLVGANKWALRRSAFSSSIDNSLLLLSFVLSEYKFMGRIFLSGLRPPEIPQIINRETIVGYSRSRVYGVLAAVMIAAAHESAYRR